MYGYIYKTTNLVNGKIYIGQKKSDKFLGNKYLGSGKYLKCAIQHYGEQVFYVSLIAIANTREELDELEKYYIKLFNATNYDVGYNIANGAVGGDTYSNLTDEDKKIRIRKNVESRKRNNKVCVMVHRGLENKRIDIELLDSYLSDGWERGRSADWQQKLDGSHKGIKQSPEWIAKRVKSGWVDKSPEEYMKMCQKHSMSTKIQMANTPKEERINRARNANKFTGKKCCFVTNGVELHFIEESELQKYLDIGYVKGMKIKE